MEKQVQEYIVMTNKAKIPTVGLGTFEQTSKENLKTAIVKCGYRHLDTAWLYLNENTIGETLEEIMKETDIKREDLFIVTKIWNSQYKDVEGAIKESLKNLKLQYVDMYLLHFPSHYFAEKPIPLHKLWEQMESLVEKGYTKSIGLSNFNVQLILDLLTYCKIKPVANQVELHPYNSQEELVRFCQAMEIVPIAYCPMGRFRTQKQNDVTNVELKLATELPDLNKEESLQSICQKHNKSVFQVVLRWNLQRGVVIIPKASGEAHLNQNKNILDFNLSDNDMKEIAKLNLNARLCTKFPFLQGFDIFA